MAKDNRDFFKNKNEWSEIKDKLLGCYLPPYFQKILTNGSPISYIDCFAGKGKFDDGKPGSPIIALRARENCLARSTQQYSQKCIETYFIELNHADELLNNIKDYIGPHKIISGKYEDEIDKILRLKKGSNIFLYIDPYGIRALDSYLFNSFDIYQFRSIEMLINFNTFGFFRDACRVMNVKYTDDEALKNIDDLIEYDPTKVDATKQSENLLTRIAGGDYWKEIVNSFNLGKINGYKAEQQFSTEYKKILQKKYCYVLDMPIRLKPAQRPKYRMIHICNHEDGCFLMGQNMQKRKDELFLNVQQKGVKSLLDYFTNDTITIENEPISLECIKKKLKDELRNLDNIRLKKLIANFINKHGLICDFKYLHKILQELESNKIIEIIRSPSITKTGKKTVFWEEDKDHTITIRRQSH